MPHVNRRRPGETVVLQELWRGRVWAARPMRVVRDDDDLVALWFPRDTRWQAPTTPPTREREATRAERFVTSLALGDWTYSESTWDVDTLQLVRPGDWHAVWVSWLPNGEHWGWYVNLQRPLERTQRGFVTMDLMLDVIVEPDRSWRYKDEDELEALVAAGIFDVQTDLRIRDEALRVIESAEQLEPPFSDPWTDWRPNPEWTLPELPADWELVAECR
jgi:hypothetical protein